MKIEIETKFDISDIVWVKRYFEDGFGYCPVKARISGINIQVYDKAVRNVSYFTTFNDLSKQDHSECDLFSMKAECQAKCDRLNEGIHD